MDHWKKYLLIEDFEYLIAFIENVKNNRPNDKMIILTFDNSITPVILNEIKKYLGDNEYHNCDLDGFAFYLPIRKMIIIDGFIEKFNKVYIQPLKNMIQYKQSIISCSNFIENVNKGIILKSKIIQIQKCNNTNNNI